MFSWLKNLLTVECDPSGIALTGDEFWEVASPKDATRFILALRSLLTPNGVLYLEDPIDERITAHLKKNQIADPVKVRAGTCWPKPTCYHLRATSENLNLLAGMAEDCCEIEICSHMIAYEKERVLLSWYDAWTDPAYLSAQYEEAVVSAFAKAAGTSYVLRREARPGETGNQASL